MTTNKPRIALVRENTSMTVTDKRIGHDGFCPQEMA